MDAPAIDMQVLSTAQPGLEHTPADRAVPVARAPSTTGIAAAIAAHPDRFAGFAALPTADPDAAARRARARRRRARPRRARWSTAARSSASSTISSSGRSSRPPRRSACRSTCTRCRRRRRSTTLYYAGFGDDVGFMLARRRLGLARRDRAALAAADARRRLRPLPGPPDDRRPHGRGAAVHDRAGERRARARDRARPGRHAHGALADRVLRAQLPHHHERLLHRPAAALRARGARRPTASCSRSTTRSATAPPAGAGSTGAAIGDEEREKIAHANAERLLGL